MSFEFKEERILPADDRRSPYYMSVPKRDAKPIDELVSYFKFWKGFVKDLRRYLGDLAITKEYSANLNYQMIKSVQFNGYKDLTTKYINAIDSSSYAQTNSLGNNQKKKGHSPSSSSLASLNEEEDSGREGSKRESSPNSRGGLSKPNTNSSNSGSGEKRPGILRTVSNNSTFMKNTLESNPFHKRVTSFNSPLMKSFQNVAQHTAQPGVHAVQSAALSLSQLQPTPLHDPPIPLEYFPDNSLFKNLPPLLINNHFQVFQHQMKLVRELNNKLIPRIETLKKNLSLKIKEIRANLKNESFGNDAVVIELSNTGKILNDFMKAVGKYSGEKPVLKNFTRENEEGELETVDDPFLLKLRLDYQLKNQLLQENYLFASYVNLQNISRDLLTYILKELNYIIQKIGKLLNQEAVYTGSVDIFAINLLGNLRKYVDTSTKTMWEHFIINNKNFINIYKDTPKSSLKICRNLDTLSIPYNDSIHSKCIRTGVMYKKMKLFKNYKGFFYVLTCNYLHEFRISTETADLENENPNAKAIARKKTKGKLGGYVGHDDEPSKSYNLNNLAIKLKDASGLKFVLSRLDDQSKKYTFKCIESQDYQNWYNDLCELLQFRANHLGRLKLLEDKMRLKEAGEKEKLHEDAMKEDKEVNEQSRKAANEEEELARHEHQRMRDSESNQAIEEDSRSNENKLNSERTDDEENQMNQMSQYPMGMLPGLQVPIIKTPLSSIETEQNPFEKTLASDASSVISGSPHDSPGHIGSVSLTPPIVASLNSQASVNHQKEHDNYLQLQKKFLRQQQELLNLKINHSSDQQLDKYQKLRHQILNQLKQQTPVQSSVNLNRPQELSRPSLPPTQQPVLVFGAPERPNSLSRASSTDSVQSMIHQAQIQQVLKANNDLINRLPEYQLNDNIPSETEPQILSRVGSTESVNDLHNEIPKFYVSSNH